LTRSDNPNILQCLTPDHANVPIVTVDSPHDVPDQSPDALIAHVNKFAGTT
jgi:hypothetical protein